MSAVCAEGPHLPDIWSGLGRVERNYLFSTRKSANRSKIGCHHSGVPSAEVSGECSFPEPLRDRLILGGGRHGNASKYLSKNGQLVRVRYDFRTWNSDLGGQEVHRTLVGFVRVVNSLL